jgi:hypothetical protein
MKKLIPILLILSVLLSSCNSLPPDPTETSDIESTTDSISISPETDPYVVTTEMFGEIYPVVEDTWHLSDWKEPHPPIKELWYYKPIDFSPEAMKTYVKLPLEYEETVDGMTIKVEFFQETYPIFSYIQARITYVNNTGSSLRFQNADKNTAGYFAAGGELYCGCYESPDFDFITHADSTTLVENGQSHVVEVIYLFTNHFDPSKTDQTYNIDACFYVPDSGFPPEVRYYSISVPIEVLNNK